MTASGDFLSDDLFCQPQQQPYLLISRPLKDILQFFSCLFHFSSISPQKRRSFFVHISTLPQRENMSILLIESNIWSDTNAKFQK
nr:MAG TPA: hypothetical protein [Caudoviricetes sp.]